MGILDKADHFKGVPLPQDGEFTKGMRSGGNAALASLNNLAGAVGQKVGAPDFAAGRFSTADQYSADAAAAAPRVTSMRDVGSFGDALDYAKGLAGGMVPVGAAALGAGLLTGGGALPAIAAGTGVMAPVEAGDIVGRMREQGQPIDLTRAVVGGTASAALQNVLPGVARARLGGTAGRLPGGALANIPEQAALAAGGEAGKQYAANAQAPLEGGQIFDAAAGGAVMGVPIAGMSALGGARGQIGAAAGAVGDAARSLGDKAKSVAGATGDAAKAGGESAKAGAEAAVQRVQGMEIPDALAGLFDGAKAKARDVADKIAKSDDVVGDVSKLAGLQGDKLKQALAGDDGERLQAVKDYAAELGDEHPAVRDWLADAGNTAKQAAVAAAKQARDGYTTARDHLTKFADSVEQRRTEKFGVKKSEDDSGIRQALSDRLIPELLKARPELADAINDPRQAGELARDLHRGFAPLIEELSSGRQPSSDTVARLIDLAGPAADRLVEVARSVLDDGTDKARAAAFFKGLNEITRVRDSGDTLVQTLRKNLAKGQERMSDAELREEAALLAKWRDDKRPTTGPNVDEQAMRLNYRVQKHLEARYGANADKVLAALEKAKPREENQLERARVKYDEDGQPIDSGIEDGYGDTDAPSGRMQFFGGGRKGMDLLPHPEDDPGKGGFKGAAEQKLERVKQAHRGTTPRFVTATEMGLDHPWVKEKHKALVKMGDEMGIDGARFAREQLDRYGVIATERAVQKTQLSFDELDAMRLDRKRYADSKSRIDAGDDVVLDAVKVVRSMTERFKDEPYSPSDERSRVARLGRMFIEGIAATQDYLGRTFDIPDSTVLGKLDGRDLTWGDVKKLDTRTAADRADDSDTKYLTELRRQFMATEDKALRAEIAKDAQEVAGPREARKNKELGRDESREQLDDALDFDGDVERGINVDKSALRTQVREVLKQLEAVGRLLDGEVQFGRGPEEVKLRQQLARLTTQLDALRARQEQATPGESLGSGQREVDPFGQVHQAAGYNARRDPEPINRDRTQQAPSLQGPDRGERTPLPEPGAPSPGLRKAAAEAARAFKAPDIDTDTIGFGFGGKSYSVRQLTPNSWEILNGKNEVIHSITKSAGEPPDPKAVAARKAAFLERARSGDESLIEEIGQHTDAVGLQNAVRLLNDSAVGEPAVARTIDALNERIGELVREQPQQAYDMLKANKSLEPADPARAGPINRKEVGDYLTRTLGNSVRVEWAKLGHAGEFERIDPGNAPIEDVVRLSVHALNPLSTAHHESLHAFMQKLSDMKHGKIMDVLLRAGESAPVLNQLRAWMTDRGMGEAALAQLKNPEERAAYMYQAWADGKLKVGDETKTALGKIADFIRSVLGIWSNDERALHIMEYFHSGDFAKNMASRDKVGADLMSPGRNRAIEAAKKMTQPILELGENLGVAGGQRLRDTGIPALRELADMMKLHTVAEGDDVGFVPAARAERTRAMNKLAADLKDHSQGTVQAALESLQTQSNAAIDALATPEERLAARQAKATVRKLLDDMYGYMSGQGVKVNDLGVGKDYFPRVWDTSYISSHQTEFLNMVNKYVALGQYRGDPKKLMHRLMVAEGAEFTAEVDKPGMQHLKPRELAFMTAADTAPFMRKDLASIISGYVTQATRRAEWARRFGDDGKGIDRLLIRAKREGATPDDLDSAQKFVRSVDGTLGDTINPEARRLFGNMIVYQNVRLLPLMIFSSAVDPMGIAVRGGTVGDAFQAFKRGVREIPKSFKKSAADDDATKFAASVGVIDDATLVHTLGALYSQGMVGDTGRKINDALFRYNMAEQFNTSMRVSATEAAMGFLARHADGTANRHSQRWLNELGLRPGEVKLGADGRPLVFEHQGLTLEQSAKMKAAINRWVDGAVLRPDAVDKPIWMSDPHFSLLAHLKQFTYSFHETILKRVAHEYQNGNYAPAMALASYVPMMIAADMAKGMIQGGGDQPSWKENWGVGDYIAAGVERAGLLGVGQFGVDMLRDAARGGAGIGALAGPTIEQFAGAAQVLGGRETFSHFALKSMPANALYAGAVGGEATDPKFVD